MITFMIIAAMSSTTPAHWSDVQLRTALRDQLDVQSYKYNQRLYFDYGNIPHDDQCEMGLAAVQIASGLRAAFKTGHLHSFPEKHIALRGDVLLSCRQKAIVATEARRWENESNRHDNNCRSSPLDRP